MPKFDLASCERRNRHAALVHGATSAPVQLFRESGEPEKLAAAEPVLLAAQGTLPRSKDEALARINALLPAGADPLTAEQVFIHYCEAANGSFIGDRYLFLDATTLKNIRTCADAGVAFMNSHRTGGMSHPSELPFGKTFCGRYERYTDEAGNTRERTIVGFYMLAQTPEGYAVYPNGTGGPSTTELDAMIRSGTLFDVSVGLWGGDELCTVCGNGLYESDDRGRYLCPHIPGTHIAMSEAEKGAQKERGVPDGCAASLLVDARMGEVSAVYDGAVPGAGFRFQQLSAGVVAPLFAGAVHGGAERKARRLARGSALDDAARGELRRVFGAHGAFADKREAKAEVAVDAEPDYAERLRAQRCADTLRRAALSASRITGESTPADADEILALGLEHLAADGLPGWHGLDTATGERLLSLAQRYANGDLTLSDAREALGSAASQLCESPRDGGSLESQLEGARVALDGCIDRADGLRRVSAGRVAQFQATLDRGQELLTRLQPAPPGPSPDPVALRQRALRLRAWALQPGNAEVN